MLINQTKFDKNGHLGTYMHKHGSLYVNRSSLTHWNSMLECQVIGHWDLHEGFFIFWIKIVRTTVRLQYSFSKSIFTVILTILIRKNWNWLSGRQNSYRILVNSIKGLLIVILTMRGADRGKCGPVRLSMILKFGSSQCYKSFPSNSRTSIKLSTVFDNSFCSIFGGSPNPNTTHGHLDSLLLNFCSAN